MKLPQISTRKDRVFTFTNKAAGFYMGGSHSFRKNEFYGWTSGERHFLDDYRVFFEGSELCRESASFLFRPDYFERTYTGGITERFFMAENEDIIVLSFSFPRKPASFSIAFLTAANRESLCLSPIGESRHLLVNGRLLSLALRAAPDGACAVLALSSCKEEGEALLEKGFSSRLELLSSRTARMEAVLDRDGFSCSDEHILDAVGWARLSLDSLMTNQGMPGIWAGLPWFNNYWGRDTFISLPGAAIVNGDFASARDILYSFAGHQKADSSDKLFGRIPNRISGGEIIYNTADAGGWFSLAAYRYMLYSGDKDAARRLREIISRDAEGLLSHRCDASLFALHGDAETWMDAVGLAGPWSPRGNRACEIQALWHAQLLILSRLAELAADFEAGARYARLAEKLTDSFNAQFVRHGRIADRLEINGTADMRNRPNAFFCLSASGLPGLRPLLDDIHSARIARGLTESLVCPHGVLSLDAADPDFHPYHEYPAYAHKDEAYHNGIVWTWLAGTAVDSLARSGQRGLAASLWREEARQILSLDALGGFAELVEAWPRPGEACPAASGTVNQAWGLAEFLRNLAESFAGYMPDALSGTFTLRPAPFMEEGSFSLNLPFGNGHVAFSCETSGGAFKVRADARGTEASGVIFAGDGASRSVNKGSVAEFSANLPLPSEDWSFAPVRPDPGIPALRPHS